MRQGDFSGCISPSRGRTEGSRDELNLFPLQSVMVLEGWMGLQRVQVGHFGIQKVRSTGWAELHGAQRSLCEKP